jgi:flavin-dependent dehydrogenase
MVLNLLQKIKKVRPLDLSNPKWHLVPIGGIKRRIGAGRILVVGDAAGFVDPLTGEGIQYAILSGKTAAFAIETMIEEQKPEESASLYARLCERAFVEDLRLAHWLATRLYNHPDLILELLFSDRKLSQAFAMVVKGEKNYRDFMAYAFRRLPILFGKKVARVMSY